MISSRKALLYGIRTALLAGAVMGSLAFFAGDLLASLFSGDSQVIAYAHDYLKAYAIDCLLTAVLFCFVGYFNGFGKTIFVMVQGVIGAFFVRIPVVFLIQRLEGATLFHIGLATPPVLPGSDCPVPASVPPGREKAHHVMFLYFLVLPGIAAFWRYPAFFRNMGNGGNALTNSYSWCIVKA